jgi:Fic family protein
MRQNSADIDDRKDDLNDLLDRDPGETRAFWEKLDRSWVFHENGLEGIVINSEEMATALQAVVPVAEAGKAAFLADIRRQYNAIKLVKEEAASPRGKITPVLVKDLFETLTGGEAGKGKIEYRRDMPLHRTYFHDITQPVRIVPDLTKLIDWTTAPDFLNLHPLQQAAQFHHKFMTIFPFTDLSGKVGRLILDIMVMRAGYMPAVIHAIDRQRYYDSLKQQPRVLQAVLTEAIEHVTEVGFKWFGHSAPVVEQQPPQRHAPRAKAG